MHAVMRVPHMHVHLIMWLSSTTRMVYDRMGSTKHDRVCVAHSLHGVQQRHMVNNFWDLVGCRHDHFLVIIHYIYCLWLRPSKTIMFIAWSTFPVRFYFLDVAFPPSSSMCTCWFHFLVFILPTFNAFPTCASTFYLDIYIYVTYKTCVMFLHAVLTGVSVNHSIYSVCFSKI